MNVEGFGSYRDNINNSEIIQGHENTLYVMGGNAQYNIQSNMISWDNIKNSSELSSKDQIILINQILRLPSKIESKDALNKKIEEILGLPNKDFIEFLENSLNLNESIIVELRRLFYIFIECDAKNKKADKIDKKFCHKNPKKCIIDLLESTSILTDLVTSNNSIVKMLKEIEAEIEKRNEIRNAFNKIPNDTDDIEKNMDNFIDNCKDASSTLEEIESINNSIAKKLEKLAKELEKEL